MLKQLLVATTLLLNLSILQAQILVDQSLTPEDYVQNVLLGNGVTASNVIVNGDPTLAQMPFSSLGYFNSGTSAFPLDSGLILATGNVNVAIGPNNSTNSSLNTGTDVSDDVDLQSIAGNLNITSGIVLEFDFIPVGNSVSFRYMFASEEYPEFAPPNGNVNDQFGFFLSGININGSSTYDTVNIAILPDGNTTVNIENINTANNAEFYQDNSAVDGVFPDAVQYDGISTILSASADVQCGLTYHIKLALCNVSDDGWDTGVFLEGGSLKSDPLQIDLSGSSISDTVMTEGCETADIVFQRSICDTIDTLTIYLSTEGTALNVDDFTGFQDSVQILSGESVASITINPFNDDVDEPTEFFTVSAFFIDPNGDTIRSSNTFYIEDYEEIELTLSDSALKCPVDSIRLDGFAQFGFGDYTYEWSNNEFYTDSFAYYPGNIEGTTNVTLTVTDECNSEAETTVSIVLENLPEANVDHVKLFGSYPLPISFESDNQNSVENHWHIPNPDGGVEFIATDNPADSLVRSFPYGQYYIYTVAISEEGCTDTAGFWFDVLEMSYITPNVFTPSMNPDPINGQNDYFDINAENAKTKILTIFNRWGNIVFETKDIDEKWDGTNKDGTPAEDGTYFYTFYVEDFQSISKEGQSFLQLIRN